MVCMNLDFYVQTALDSHIAALELYPTIRGYAVYSYNLSIAIDVAAEATHLSKELLNVLSAHVLKSSKSRSQLHAIPPCQRRPPPTSYIKRMTAAHSAVFTATTKGLLTPVFGLVLTVRAFLIKLTKSNLGRKTTLSLPSSIALRAGI